MAADPNPVLSLLRECVVRIDGDGEFLGTGFFVAPGRVLTCAHVVHGRERLSVVGPDWHTEVEALTVVPELEADSPEAQFYPPPDVALLRLSEAPASHPCVRLEAAEPSAAPADVLYLHGYSRDEYGNSNVSRSSAAVEYKGTLGTGDAEVLKLGGDQVLRGYSGCPALNLRTGGVCALVDSTRDASTDLGGFGIPLSLIGEAIPGLLEENAAEKEALSAWELAAEQEKTARREREESNPLPILAPLADLKWSPDSPQSHLLKPRFAVVDLIGRESLQAQLMRWRETQERLGVVLITGGGGFGKTRLALEECERARRAGWTAGLFTLDTNEGLAEALGQLERWPGRLFLAIDYAETRPSIVTSLMLRLSRRLSGPPVRLLLICRQVQSRQEIERLFAVGDGREEIEGVLASAEPVRLDQHELDRRRLFEDGVGAFAKRLGQAPLPVPHPSLRELHFARPLFVLVAALLLAQDRTADIDSMSRQDLMLEVIDRHESEYWQRLNDDLGVGLDPTSQGRAVAIATTLGAETEEEALSLVSVIPGFEDASAERLRAVARWLSRLYGDGLLDAPPAVVPVEPDMLAETLISREFTSSPELLGASISAASDAQLARALGVLTKASEGNGELAERLAAKFREVLDERLPSLIDRAQAAGGELAGSLDLAIASIAPLAGASAVAASRPSLVTLGPMGASVGRLAVDHWRARVEDDRAANLPALATTLYDLAFVLDRHGIEEEALAMIQEAAEYRRELAENGGNSELADLARSLDRLSNQLDGIGKHEEALATTEAAVEYKRALAQSGDDEALADLGGSLNNLSTVLVNLGRLEEALEAIEESADKLKAVEEGPRWRPNLAMVLTNMAMVLSRLARYEPSLRVGEEAAQHYRELLAEEPNVHLPPLATVLDTVSTTLSELGRADEALAAVEESVDRQRDLVEIDAGRYLAGLAGSLNNLSNRLNDVGRAEEALAAIEESVAAYRVLLAQGRVQYMGALATGLNNLSNRLDDLGRGDEALTAIEESVEYVRELATTNPVRYVPDLAMSLNNLSTVLVNLGRLEEAVARSKEAVEHRRSLVEKNEDMYLPGLASALNNLSVILGRMNRLEEARTAVDEAVGHYRTLAARYPARFQDHLGSSLNNLSNRLDELGRHAEALEAIEESVGLRRALAESKPARYVPDLAMSLNNLSTVLLQLARLTDALEAIEQAVGWRRTLAKENPVRYVPDLAGSLSNMVVVCDALGEPEKSKSLIASVIDEQGEPTASSLLLTRARWHEKTGDVESAVADGMTALERARGAGDGSVRGEVRSFLRALRGNEQQAFDAAWTAKADGPLPVWLQYPEMDTEALELVLDWMRTPDWATSRTFLEEHEELLGDPYLAALEHLADERHGHPEVASHLVILTAARADGIAAPYELIAQGIQDRQRESRVGEWLRVEPSESQRFLSEHADELLDPRCEGTLLARALDGGPVELYVPLGLLTLARSQGPDRAYELLEDPGERIADAECVEREREPSTLGVARLQAGLQGGDVDLQFRHALAAMAHDSMDEAAQAMERCGQELPSWERVEYLRRLTQLGKGKPGLAAGVDRLREALDASAEEAPADRPAGPPA